MLKTTEVYPTRLQKPKVRYSNQLHLEEELTIRLSDQANDRLKLHQSKTYIYINQI